ncbi:MAG: YlmC/YmxH family sporulation protein [Clostridia bacterium]|nr:YlmC/YmxH family sporulation protein [Clostridia bacterium]
MGACLRRVRDKEVIDIQNGKRIGRVYDVEIDAQSGCVCALIVLVQNDKLFAKAEYLTLFWQNIKKIGDDFILCCIEDIVCK